MCLLKESSLLSNYNLDKSNILELRGITEQYVYTLGVLILKINLKNNKTLEHPFYIIPESVPVKHDGLLGRDFLLKYEAKMNYEDEILSFENNDFKIMSSETITISA